MAATQEDGGVRPRDEPEIVRLKAELAAQWYNKITREPYDNIYIAMDLAQQAYEAHGLPYQAGLSAMDRYAPDRFTWICVMGPDGWPCVKVRDDQTGRAVVWPHWFA